VISRTVRELRHKFIPVAQFKKVYFANDPMFKVIINRQEQDLPIIVHGELAQIQLDFSYVVKVRNPVTHQMENLKCMRYDPNKGDYSKQTVVLDAIKLFIEEQLQSKKAEIINKHIQKAKRNAYECD
jgi:hypothetical protein